MKKVLKYINKEKKATLKEAEALDKAEMQEMLEDITSFIDNIDMVDDEGNIIEAFVVPVEFLLDVDEVVSKIEIK